MTDPQSRAFRDATPGELDGTELVENEHATLADLDPAGPLKTVAEYEADGWDAERSGPKSLHAARENLAARIADPAAPDTEHEAGAYDHEGA